MKRTAAIRHFNFRLLTLRRRGGEICLRHQCAFGAAR